MVIGTGKLFTVLARAGGSGAFCQDYKSNPAKALLLSAGPIRPAATGLTAAQGV